MLKSRALAKLRSGELVKVAGISRVGEPWLAELTGRLGYDVIWFDMEHRLFGYEVLDPLALACRATGIDLMVRVLKEGYQAPMRALEAGANGTMVPHCKSAAEAKQWADWARFPPLGKRGFDGAGADCDYMLDDSQEFLKHANRETFLMLQIEDPEAVEAADEIAAVEGVDLLFVGPADLSIAYGVPLQVTHPLIEKAIERVAAACARGEMVGHSNGEPGDCPEARRPGSADDHVRERSRAAGERVREGD